MHLIPSIVKNVAKKKVSRRRIDSKSEAQQNDNTFTPISTPIAKHRLRRPTDTKTRARTKARPVTRRSTRAKRTTGTYRALKFS